MFPESLVVNPGRLRILTALAESRREEFVPLRNRTRLTDGNLAAHGKRLHAAGLIDIDKQFRDGKPVTTYLLTPDGRKALEAHARRLFAAITQRRRPDAHAQERVESAAPSPAPAPAAPVHDDWVD